MDAIERRVFLKGAGMGALAFTVGGAQIMMTPGAARAQGVPFRLLNANEGETIEALGFWRGDRAILRTQRASQAVVLRCRDVGSIITGGMYFFTVALKTVQRT